MWSERNGEVPPSTKLNRTTPINTLLSVWDMMFINNEGSLQKYIYTFQIAAGGIISVYSYKNKNYGFTWEMSNKDKSCMVLF